MRRFGKSFLLGLLLGLLLLLCGAALGLASLHMQDQFYLFEVDRLQIERASGFSREEILMNYQAMMDYLSPFATRPFELPTLPYSEGGAFHFYECKVLFRGFYLLGALSGLLLIGFEAALRKRKLSDDILLIAGLSVLLLPLLGAALIAINQEAAFYGFHRVFFDNELWIFDARTDPIILILPFRFFMDAAVWIFSFWMLFAAGTLLRFKIRRRRA